MFVQNALPACRFGAHKSNTQVQGNTPILKHMTTHRPHEVLLRACNYLLVIAHSARCNNESVCSGSRRRLTQGFGVQRDQPIVWVRRSINLSTSEPMWQCLCKEVGKQVEVKAFVLKQPVNGALAQMPKETLKNAGFSWQRYSLQSH